MLVRWLVCLNLLVAYKGQVNFQIDFQRSRIAFCSSNFVITIFIILFLFVFQNLSFGFNKIDINKASLKELEEIPGIGKILAQRIVKYREKYGSFKSIEELKNIKGIGSKKFELLKKYLKVEKILSVSIDQNSNKKSENKNFKLIIYYYKDNKGIIHYTQFPENVPLKYKGSLKVLNH